MNKKAQSTLEFTLVFVIVLLFIFCTVNLFVWFNHCIVRRQVSYEQSRGDAAGQAEANVGKSDFYTPNKLNVFTPGGLGAN
jgi:uncharacterized protein (UPF0333 family)